MWRTAYNRLKCLQNPGRRQLGRLLAPLGLNSVTVDLNQPSRSALLSRSLMSIGRSMGAALVCMLPALLVCCGFTVNKRIAGTAAAGCVFAENTLGHKIVDIA
jgi:hypothetical protein